jgi:hypothetical protein
MAHASRICSLLFFVSLPICPSRATSVVVLANKSQIGVAADQKVISNGKRLPDDCKILRQGDLLFTLAGRVRDLDGRRYDARNILVQASKGLTDLSPIRQRFDELVMAPLQKQVDHDFEHNPQSFQKSNHSAFLEMIIFRVTSAGSEMVQSVFYVSIGETAKLEPPTHRSCTAGNGDCQLTAGEQDGMTEYLYEHPFTTNLAADAERLVKFEAHRHPDKVGGKITVILIDENGIHSANSNDKCPVNWGDPTSAVHRSTE